MKITITVEVDPDNADESDRMGITNDAYEELTDTLMELGYSDFDVKAVG